MDEKPTIQRYRMKKGCLSTAPLACLDPHPMGKFCLFSDLAPYVEQKVEEALATEHKANEIVLRHDDYEIFLAKLRILLEKHPRVFEQQVQEAVEKERERCLGIMRKEFAEAVAGAQSIMEDEVTKAVGKERELAVEAIAARDEYIDLFSEELNEACGMAIVHGWRSSRVEAGEKCRKRIEDADTAVRAAQEKEAKS